MRNQLVAKPVKRTECVNVTIKIPARLVQLVFLVMLELTETLEPQASLVPKDPQAFTAVLLTKLTLPAKFVHQVPKDPMVHQAHQALLVPKAFQAKMVHQAKMAARVQAVHQAQLAKLANQAVPVPKVPQAKMAKKAPKASKDPKVHQAQAARKDQEAHQAQMANKEAPANQDQPAHQAKEANQDPKDHQVPRANQEAQAKMHNIARAQNDQQPKSKKFFNSDHINYVTILLSMFISFHYPVKVNQIEIQ